MNDGTVNSFRLDLEVSSATHLTASQVTNSVFVLERNEGNAAIRWLQIDIDAETVTPLSAAGDVELPQARGTVRETDEEGFWYAEGDSGAKWVYYNMTLNANNNIQHEILPGVADDGTVSFDSLHPDSTAAFSWNVDGAGIVYLVARFAANKFRPLAVEKDETVTLYPGILEQEAGFGGGTIPRVVVPARGVFYTHGQWNRHISPHTGIGGGTGEDEFTVGSGLARFEFDEMAGEISNDWEWQIFPSGSQPLGIVPHFDESGDLFVIDRALTLTGTGAGNGRFDDDVYRQLDVRRLCKCNEVDEARIFEVANPLGAWSYTFTNPAHESLIESMLVEADLLYDDEETGCHWMHEGQQSGGGVTATLTWDLAVTHNTTDATLVDYTLTVTLALTGAINDSHSVSYSESSVEPTDSGPFTFDCDTDLAGRTWNIGGGNQIIFPAEFTVSVDDTAVPD